MEAEKDDRPGDIKNQLKTKMHQGKLNLFFIPPFFKDQIRGDSHHYIKNDPDRTKKPVWRIKRRLIKRHVPGWN